MLAIIDFAGFFAFLRFFSFFCFCHSLCGVTTRLIDSIGIPEPPESILELIGCTLAVTLKNDENGYLKVTQLLSTKQAETLPVWQGYKPEPNIVSKFTSIGDEIDDDEDLPF